MPNPMSGVTPGRSLAREVQELQVFVAVAEAGGFTRAAARLQTSLSALSQSVRALEARLGLRLLNRTTRNVALTAAGQHLLDRLRPALDALGEAVGSLASFRSGPVGIVRVSVVRLAYRLHVEGRLGSVSV